MQHKEYVKIGLSIASAFLVVAALTTMTIFAMDPSKPEIFTNALIIVLILVQLMTVNMLIQIYEKLEAKGGRRR